MFGEVLNVQGNVSLCELHYQAIYQQLHKLSPCGANQKYKRNTPDIAQMLSLSPSTYRTKQALIKTLNLPILYANHAMTCTL